MVETARYGTKTVVCGAPNCAPGMQTVYVPVGEGRSKAWKATACWRAASNSASIATTPASSNSMPKCSLAPDSVIEVDNKSLTHRPDLWGHHGMAREMAAITQKPLRDPVTLDLLPQGPPEVGIEIEDFALCPRYSALVFENVTVAAVAAVAAVPLGGDRSERDQQYRRRNQLRHGGAGAADARLRRRQAARRARSSFAARAPVNRSRR